MRPALDRSGASTSDVLIFLATLGLAAALLYPAWSAREFRSRVAAAVNDVESLRSAARSTLDERGTWPSPAAPGAFPPELARLPSGGALSRVGYTLQWTNWSVVDSVVVVPDVASAPDDAPADSAGPTQMPIVREVGAVAVHSGEAALLAEMAEHFAGEMSFVLDTIWMLVLPERGDPALR
jgi:hypothetical protein